MMHAQTTDPKTQGAPLFPLSPAMVRRLRSHDAQVGDLTDQAPAKQLHFKDSGE